MGRGVTCSLANGRGASFEMATSLAREEFIVALELDDREREARINLAAPLARSAPRTVVWSMRASLAEDSVRVGLHAIEAVKLARRVRRLDALAD